MFRFRPLNGYYFKMNLEHCFHLSGRFLCEYVVSERFESLVVFDHLLFDKCMPTDLKICSDFKSSAVHSSLKVGMKSKLLLSFFFYCDICK